MSNEKSFEDQKTSLAIDEATFTLMQNDIDLLRKHNEAHPTLTGIEYEKCMREYLELSKSIAEEDQEPTGQFSSLAKEMGKLETELRGLHAEYLFEQGQYQYMKPEEKTPSDSFLIVPENPKLQ